MVATEEETTEYWRINGNAAQRRRARAVSRKGTTSKKDAAFRSKIKKKYREKGILAIKGAKLGRPTNDKLRAAISDAIKIVQKRKNQPTREDYRIEIALRLKKKDISESTLTRYFKNNEVKIRPRKPKP